MYPYQSSWVASPAKNKLFRRPAMLAKTDESVPTTGSVQDPSVCGFVDHLLTTISFRERKAYIYINSNDPLAGSPHRPGQPPSVNQPNGKPTKPSNLRASQRVNHQPSNQSTSQLASQLMGQQTNDPTSEPAQQVNQPTIQLPSQPTSQPTNQPGKYQQASQLTNQPDKQQQQQQQPATNQLNN